MSETKSIIDQPVLERSSDPGPLTKAFAALSASQERERAAERRGLEKAVEIAHARGEHWKAHSDRCCCGGHEWRYERGMRAGAFDVEDALQTFISEAALTEPTP